MRIWSRAPKGDRTLFIASVALFVTSLGVLGVREHRAQANSGDELFYRFMDVAAEVYSEVKSKYVEEIDSREILDAGLRGMFSVLDEHSQYMDPKVLEDLEKDTGKEYGGVGIHITTRQRILTVIAPMPGSPAAKAGIKPWDRIVEVDGESTEKLSINDAVERLMGPPGTSVKIKIFREGEPELLDFELERSNIRIESVTSKMLDGDVGYVRISKFSENTTTDLRRAVMRLRSDGMKALVLDLRFNTGGLLREAIDVSDMFLDKGATIVSTKGRLRNQNREYRAATDPLVRVPVFVLTNRGSASASEIVAGALQDHHVAVVLGPAGSNTYGKGSVQTIEALEHSMEEDKNGNPRSSALRLTTARYYTPSGRTIHQLGITPDIGVPLPQGHETELLERGLLGDPSNPRPTEEDNEGNPTQPGDPFWMRAKTPKLPDTPFVDIMLEEARRLALDYLELKPTRNAESEDAVLRAETSDKTGKNSP